MSVEFFVRGGLIASATVIGGALAVSYMDRKDCQGPDKTMAVIAAVCIGFAAGGGLGYVFTRPQVYNGIYAATCNMLKSIKIDFVIFPRSWVQIRIPIYR